MGLFSWKRTKKDDSPAPPPEGGFALIFLFSSLPSIEEATLSQRLAPIDEMNTVRVSDTVATCGAVHARLTVGAHSFRLVGFDRPAPKEAIANAIECSHWRKEDKQPLRDHQAHVICYYTAGSDDASEQMLAFWKLAGAFLDAGLCGIADPDAWNCIPAHALKDLLTPEMLSSCRADLPLGLWTGFAKLFKNEEDVWFCSKGFHRWGVMDFAYLGKHVQAEEVFALINGLFRYVRESGAVIKPGHTAQFGDALLRFGQVSEHRDYLIGPLGTLTVEKLRAHQHASRDST